MGQELQAQGSRELAPEALADVSAYLTSLGNTLKEHHKKQFVTICRVFKLNPFLREIYGVPYGDKFSIIVGYEVYLKRAEMSGMLDGWKVWTDGAGNDLVAKIEIRRKDRKEPFFHEVFLPEYRQQNQMWTSKPKTMLKKVAIGQGFRLAFPIELSGIPYTEEEIAAGVCEPPVAPAPEGAPADTTPETKTPFDAGQGVSDAQTVESTPATVEGDAQPHGPQSLPPSPEAIPQSALVLTPEFRRDAVMKGYASETVFIDFMVARKWLGEGQTTANLTDNQIERLFNNSAQLGEIFKAWKAARNG